MTRTLRDGQQAEIYKRHGLYYVTGRGYMLPDMPTHDLSWAFYRWLCCM